ncbi:hypothetical protein H6G06_12560 [Anabaena sphaerica FACHB-251]|uniref:Uncharacterized protein n=1 Tax=Anabaena sphaerica FACHB-251 TaxID=2692883 RepID=A0A926WGX9_9NOST|nr:hypothetical protein [Anabaena sphaerica]MBD2294297.1 hypothetical protein [Anabaena sphaerica FACHB-251]
MQKWFRYSLLATAIMNLAGAVIFALPIYGKGDVFGLPNAHPLYLWIISSWILIFGVAYFWLALTAKPERLYIAVVAACKLAIAFIFFAFWMTGDLPFITASAGGGDFFFAIIFIYWLFQRR